MVTSVNSLGMYSPYVTNNFGYGQYYPYMGAYTNNLSFQAAPQTQTAATVSSSATTAPTTSVTTETSEGKNKSALPVLGIIAAVGVTALCIAAYKRGPQDATNVFKRIGGGFKNMFNGAKGKLTAKSAEIITNANKSGQTVVTIPGEKNVIKGTEAATELAKIGESTPKTELAEIVKGGDGTPGLLNKGNELRSFVYDIPASGESGKAYKVISAKGGKKLTVLEMNEAGKIVGKRNLLSDLQLNDKTTYDSIMSLVKDTQAGKVSLNDRRLAQFIVRNTNAETGLVSTIKYTPTIAADGSVSTGSKLLGAVSEKFGLDHETVLAYRKNHPSFNNAIKALEESKVDGLKVLQGTVRSDSLGGTFVLDGSGNILEFRKDDGTILKAGTKAFDALSFKEAEIFKAASETKKADLKDVIYRAAA